MGENKQQELILESKSKRIVVLACPGSGKTTTLTKKIIGLYKSGVSFTSKKACLKIKSWLVTSFWTLLALNCQRGELPSHTSQGV